jgi:hypothetical protein
LAKNPQHANRPTEILRRSADHRFVRYGEIILLQHNFDILGIGKKAFRFILLHNMTHRRHPDCQIVQNEVNKGLRNYSEGHMKLSTALATAAVATLAIAAPAQAASTRANVSVPVQAVQSKMLKRSSQGVSTRSKNAGEELLVALPIVATGALILTTDSNDPVSPGG